MEHKHRPVTARPTAPTPSAPRAPWITWRLNEAGALLGLLLIALVCMGFTIVVVTLAPDKDWAVLLWLLLLAAVPTGALTLVACILGLAGAVIKDRSITALLLLTPILWVWLRVISVGVSTSPTSSAKWAMYGAIAFALLPILSSRGGDRYQRWISYDTTTGRQTSATPWRLVGSFIEPGCLSTILAAVCFAVMGAALGAAAFGVKLLWPQ